MKPYICSRCPARWGGEATCHCSGCHVTFGDLAAFDRHLVYPLDAAGKPDRAGRPEHVDPSMDPWFELSTRGYWSSAAGLKRARARRCVPALA